MKIKIVTIPIHAGSEQENELNRFLSSHRILSVDKRFVEAGADSAWSICLCWTELREQAPIQKGKIDYKQVLNENEFALYASVRELRKRLAEQEGVPAYALFTNEQLAEMVQQHVAGITDLAKIKGVGTARAQKYGEEFVRCLKNEAQKLKKVEKSGSDNASKQLQLG
ncbi:MAG: HRDC domain-containing protein [bacterium]